MALNGIIRRASSFLGLTSSESSKPTYEDGDIVFCKNNVCVHPPSRCRGEGERDKIHHPGYLVIKCQQDPITTTSNATNTTSTSTPNTTTTNTNTTTTTTLHLSWIPNDRLRRNHDLIAQNAEGNSRSNSPCPTSDSESLSVSSLALHDPRKTSLDDMALSTSGISTMDTTSDGTQSKEEEETSPNSEGGSRHSPEKAAQGMGVEGEGASGSDYVAEGRSSYGDLDQDLKAADETPDTPKYTFLGGSIEMGFGPSRDSNSNVAGVVAMADSLEKEKRVGICSSSSSAINQEDRDAELLTVDAKRKEKGKEKEEEEEKEKKGNEEKKEQEEEEDDSSCSNSQKKNQREENLSDNNNSGKENKDETKESMGDKENMGDKSRTPITTSEEAKEFTKEDAETEGSLDDGQTYRDATQTTTKSNEDTKTGGLALRREAKEPILPAPASSSHGTTKTHSPIQIQTQTQTQTHRNGNRNATSTAKPQKSKPGTDKRVKARHVSLSSDSTSSTSSSNSSSNSSSSNSSRNSSNSNSTDDEKLAESLTITENTGIGAGAGGQLASEGDEDSLGSESSHEPHLPSPPPHCLTLTGNNAEQYWYEGSAESMAYSANLAFPDTASLSSFCATPVDGGSSPIRRGHKCGIFSIDLRQSKSLRLFFSDMDNTCGQLVIASRESQYKIFHFHHGGLDKLAAVFEDWNFLVKPTDEETKAGDTSLKQFLVCKPEVSESELHPEEGQLSCLDADAWVTYFNEDGQIEDDLAMRRAIFFGGVEPQLRANVWPFLLHYYDFRTTFLERQAIMEEKHQLYHKINVMREGMQGQELDWFRRNVQCTVEKDVVRTDRSNPCFAGNDNPNLEKMKRILLNFAVHNPVMGYTQGMSDILAPILAEVRNEADVFWCFTGLMSKTIFVTSPKDEDMEKNLSYLRELLRLMTPRFYNHMANQQDGMDLLFCHRWILLCFKREFPVDEALAMWEACWSNYQTDYFHLFLSVAIVSIYGADVVDQNLRPDETLLYFTSLAGHMQGLMVLKKARGLLHHYRSMTHLPCTLVGLCELCGPGMWDSGHVPVVACVGHPEDQPCPLTQPSVTSNAFSTGNGQSTSAS